jgi:hypothetical protein
VQERQLEQLVQQELQLAQQQVLVRRLEPERRRNRHR